jgi:hypothetical protein
MYAFDTFFFRDAMRTVYRLKSVFGALALAFIITIVAGGALAHELDHALDQHQELCALHHYAGHHGGLPSAKLHPPAPSLRTRLDFPASRQFVSKQRPAPYAVRAPPSA